MFCNPTGGENVEEAQLIHSNIKTDFSWLRLKFEIWEDSPNPPEIRN